MHREDSKPGEHGDPLSLKKGPLHSTSATHCVTGIWCDWPLEKPET